MTSTWIGGLKIPSIAQTWYNCADEVEVNWNVQAADSQ
jgi:hypothetical protein